MIKQRSSSQNSQGSQNQLVHSINKPKNLQLAYCEQALIYYKPLIQASHQKPFLKNIVYIESHYTDGRKSGGTGTIIQQGIIITCAHNLFAPEVWNELNRLKYTRRQADKIYFYYKQKIEDELCQQKKIQVKQWRYMVDFVHKKQNDFAILYFEQKPKIQLFDKLIINWDQQIQEIKKEIQQKYIIGYLQVSKKRCTLKNIKLFCGQNNNFSLEKKNQNSNLLRYECSTQSGQSGSSIVCLMKQGDYIIIGIHTLGSEYGNMGIRLRKQLHQNYEVWVKDLKRPKLIINLIKQMKIKSTNMLQRVKQIKQNLQESVTVDWSNVDIIENPINQANIMNNNGSSQINSAKILDKQQINEMEFSTNKLNDIKANLNNMKTKLHKLKMIFIN